MKSYTYLPNFYLSSRMDVYSIPGPYIPKSDMLPKLYSVGTTPFRLKNYDSKLRNGSKYIHQKEIL